MATITSKSQMRFLFLQVLLLSSHCLSTEASGSSSDPNNVNSFTRDTALRDDLSHITITNHLRASNKLSDSSNSSHHTSSNATDSTTNVTSFSHGSSRHLRTSKNKKEHAISSNVDISQTPIQIPDNSSPSEGDGIGDNMFRIVGGTYHDAEGMPNFAMLLGRTGNEYYSSGCGGSLISPCHVLTAAHCVDNPNKVSGMGIYINAYRPWGDNNGLTSHFTTLAAYAIHPSYGNSAGGRPVNDVAILTLSTCVDQNENNPNLFLENIMELATMDDWNQLNHGQRLHVSGFGSTVVTGVGGNSNEFSDLLKTVAVPYQAQCSAQGYYTQGLVQDNDMMCAGSTGSDACFGDSGGPLYFEYSSTPTRHPRRKQYGIVSWGQGCGIANKPGVYASVAHHYDYIKRIVCLNPMVQTIAWGGSGTSATASNMCGRLQASPTRRPTKPPTPAPTRKPSPPPTPRPTRPATPAPTRDDSIYSFADGSTAERKIRTSVNDKVAEKLSGGSYVSSLARIRGGSLGGSANQPNERRRRRQLGADAVQGPEEAV